MTTESTFEVTTVDYSTETGPYWYVVVDDTPVLPEQPLPLEKAIAAFRREVAEAAEYDGVVELRQCGEEDLKWAGVEIARESDVDEPEPCGDRSCLCHCTGGHACGCDCPSESEDGEW